jgi:hypothetical protein
MPKIAIGIKLVIGAGALFTLAAVGGLPVHDFWFDVVLLMFFSGLVGGMPEPDSDMSVPRWAYTWFYRSSHLWVSQATAYFLHQTKWTTIRDGVEETTSHSSSKQS